LQREASLVDKITWHKAGEVTKPGRYMLRFGWLTVTTQDLAVWKQFPDAMFTLVKRATGAARDEPEEFLLGTFELPVNSPRQP
jgi:hypothetical protein